MDSIIPNQQQPSPKPFLEPEKINEPAPQPVVDFSSFKPPAESVIRIPVASAYNAPVSAPTPVANPVAVEPITETHPIEPKPQAQTESQSEPVVEPQPEMVTEKVSYADSSIQELEIAKIIANPYQPRTQFKPEALQELADSIKEHGVIQPVVVTETPTGYELVVGERRFRASQLAGLTKIPAIVKKTLHDQTKLEVALIENIQRQELNAIEEARGYDRLIKSFNLTQDQVAKKVGKSRSAVANTLRLLNLPAEIQRGVVEGKLSEGHARAILGLGDIERMILMYQTILEQGLNVRQVESKVREIVVKRKMDAAMPDPKLMAIETELRGKLGAQVKIQRQGRGGKITIDFYSDEDLEEIMNRMAEQHSESKPGGSYLVV